MIGTARGRGLRSWAAISLFTLASLSGSAADPAADPAAGPLPPERLRDLALSAILFRSNGLPDDSLFGITKESPDKVKSDLARDWSVRDRDGLLATIARTEVNGHAPLFRDLLGIIEAAGPEADPEALLAANRPKLPEQQVKYLAFLSLNYDRCRGRGFDAWDLGRCVALARWGYGAGFVSEDEAWAEIGRVAEKARERYSSWRDFGEDYALGRAVWAAGFDQELRYYAAAEAVLKRLLEPGNPWSVLPWSDATKEVSP
jgi:hypothetical protein